MTQLYHSSLLQPLSWLDHGFGTRYSTDWPPESQRLHVKQVHSDVILRADGEPGCAGEGDALIGNAPGPYLTIRTADCIPILLADPVHRAVAAVHAGWRGSAVNIAGKTVARFRSEFGAAAQTLIAAIGPAIGECCYEVGPEVLEHFVDFGPGVSNGNRLNLAEVNRRQLATAGVQHIEVLGLCTFCGGEFHSYRRDREKAGRLVSAVQIRP